MVSLWAASPVCTLAARVSRSGRGCSRDGALLRRAGRRGCSAGSGGTSPLPPPRVSRFPRVCVRVPRHSEGARGLVGRRSDVRFCDPSSVLFSSGRFRFLAHAGSLRVSVARRLRPATARLIAAALVVCARSCSSRHSRHVYFLLARPCLTAGLAAEGTVGQSFASWRCVCARGASTPVALHPGLTPRLDAGHVRGALVRDSVPVSQRLLRATWLILPVVICLSQRLSHACLSISDYTVKLRMAH